MAGTRVPSLYPGGVYSVNDRSRPSAIVLHETFLDSAHGRSRIGNVRDGDARGRKDCLSLRRVDPAFQRALEGVGRVDRRLTPGEECLGIPAGEGEESLVGDLVAAEQALGSLTGEIELIEERAVPVGRNAVAVQVDGITFLDDDAGSIREYAQHRIAGVLVKFVGGEIPQQARLLLRIVDVDDEGLSPVLVVVVFGTQGAPRFFASVVAGITLDGARDFRRRRAEGRLGKHDLVAIGDVGIPVAAVERFSPYESGGIGRTPRKIAWAKGNSVDGHAIGKGQRGDCMYRNVCGLGDVPRFDFLREAIVRSDV